MTTNKLLEQLIQGQALEPKQMEFIIQSCMTGEMTDAQIGAFLALMRMKGESISELSVAARVMQGFAHAIDLGDNLIDIVGTGGDGKNTFNVSTISSFVVSAAGLSVAKHGNRASSGKSGGADLLLAAGFNLNLSDTALQICMQKCHIAFLFAPHFHKAMQHVKTVRQQLGIRTLFNLLGPLINPAKVKKQVVGVYPHQLLQPIANVLAQLGSERALVLSSQDGLDEISIAAPTDVVEYRAGNFTQWTIDPVDYGCAHPHLEGIIIESPAHSLSLAQSVFAGQPGPARDIVLLNSAAAIYCAGLVTNFKEAMDVAKTAIDTGAAGERFIQLRDLSQEINHA